MSATREEPHAHPRAERLKAAQLQAYHPQARAALEPVLPPDLPVHPQLPQPAAQRHRRRLPPEPRQSLAPKQEPEPPPPLTASESLRLQREAPGLVPEFARQAVPLAPSCDGPQNIPAQSKPHTAKPSQQGLQSASPSPASVPYRAAASPAPILLRPNTVACPALFDDGSLTVCLLHKPRVPQVSF